MTSTTGRTSALAALAAALAMGAAGCGGSSGDVWAGIVAGFTAEEPSPGPSSVSLAQADVRNDLVQLRVRVTDVEGLYGAAFYVMVDPTIARLEHHAPGEILEAGPHTPLYLVEEAQPGVIVVSATRLGPVPAVDVVGTRTLLSLTFRVVGIGSCAASFQAAALYGDELQPAPMPGVSWFGGEIVGR